MNNPEQILLCQILLNNNILYSTNLKESDFLDPVNREIYKTIVKILEDGNEADIKTVYQYNKNIDASYLSELSSCYGSAANYKFYEKKVVEIATLNHWSKLPAMITDLCKDGSSKEILEEIDKTLVNITTRSLKDQIHKVSSLISPYMDELEKRAKSTDKIPGIHTGFDILDNMIGGFQKRRYYIFGGRPSAGKTALLGNMCLHSAVKRNVPTGVFSAESSRFELLNRFYASLGKINSKSLQFGLFNQTQLKTLMSVSDDLFKSNMYIYDVPNVELQELKSQARRMVAVHGVKIIFVDYIGIIQNKVNLPRNEQIQQISLELKQLARELDIPIVALAQIGRKADGRYPIKSDLADSAGLERDADTIVLIHHERSDNKDIEKTYLIVDKNRDGELGVINANFAGQYATFYEGMRK